MKEHRLDAPDEVKEDGRSPRDRSDLAAPYLNVTSKPEPTEVEPDDATATNSAKKMRRLLLIIGIAIPLPFLVAKALVEVFLYDLRASNIFGSLPIVVLSTVLSVAFLATVYFNISKKLIQYGLSPVSYLALHLSCLALVSHPLYSVLLLSKDGGINQLLFAFGMIAVSAVLAWIIGALMTNEQMSGSAKAVVTTAIVAMCLAVSVVYLLTLHAK